MAVITDFTHRVFDPRAGLHLPVQTFARRAMCNRRLAYALIAVRGEREIDAEKLKYRRAISQLTLQLVRAGQSDGSFSRRLRGDVGAIITVGGCMEALVGPLSPLTTEHGSHGARDAVSVGQLPGEIADFCCACVVDTRAATATGVRTVDRRSA